MVLLRGCVMNFYCGTPKTPDELTLNEVKSTIKVCNGYDDLSKINCHKLVEDNKDLEFMKMIRKYPVTYQGKLIRWLYRGLSLYQAIYKIECDMRNNFFFRRKYTGWSIGAYDTDSPYPDRYRFMKVYGKLPIYEDL